jgi:hypothetical protein
MHPESNEGRATCSFDATSNRASDRGIGPSRAPSSRAWVVNNHSLLGSREPTLL